MAVRVDIGAGLNQKADNVQVTAGSRHVQRRPVIPIFCVDVGKASEQCFSDLHIAPHGSYMKRCFAA